MAQSIKAQRGFFMFQPEKWAPARGRGGIPRPGSNASDSGWRGASVSSHPLMTHPENERNSRNRLFSLDLRQADTDPFGLSLMAFAHVGARFLSPTAEPCRMPRLLFTLTHVLSTAYGKTVARRGPALSCPRIAGTSGFFRSHG